MPDLLLEIGCEEIPARMIDDARVALSRVSSFLLKERLVTPDQTTEDLFKDATGVQGKVITDNLTALSSRGSFKTDTSESFSTPRRIALICPGVLSAQADVEEQITGPAIKVAYKDGKPTAAAEAFAKKVNLPIDKLGKITTPKGEYLAATVLKKGRLAIEVLPKLCPEKSHPSTGLRVCIGDLASRNGLCVQCAGLWQCWMARSFLWSSAASRRAISHADIASLGHPHCTRGTLARRFRIAEDCGESDGVAFGGSWQF